MKSRRCCEFELSHGSFYDLRKMIAKEIGIYLDDMEGFGGLRPWREVLDDSKYFLIHSYYDGKISPERCGKIAKRLRDISAHWENNDEYGPAAAYYRKYYRSRALELAESMEDCCTGNYPLMFV